ncbi:MAG: 8-oxo-dGTP diphosphatase [Desulfobulbaceae bacterium]|nr:8-oxo-dGTP diphosphatase [Desulfobulbaceae bacterium]
MYTPIIGTLGFVLSPCGKNCLLIHRNARTHDQHYGKYNGLGGKMLPNEDVATCLTREIKEEAGIQCLKYQLRGTINWPGFGPQGENWLGFIFLVTQYEGDIYQTNNEGDLLWHPINDLQSLTMWEGDAHFLPMVFDKNPLIFHGHMPYKNGRPLSWNYTRS